jgi:hypothetical protein
LEQAERRYQRALQQSRNQLYAKDVLFSNNRERRNHGLPEFASVSDLINHWMALGPTELSYAEALRAAWQGEELPE